jgi:hypothetical protein
MISSPEHLVCWAKSILLRILPITCPGIEAAKAYTTETSDSNVGDMFKKAGRPAFFQKMN